MAHFRGTVRGARGEASRLGHKSSGLTVEAQSWQGKVVVELYDNLGSDYARVMLCKHSGAGIHRIIYDGPVSGTRQLALAV